MVHNSNLLAVKYTLTGPGKVVTAGDGVTALEKIISQVIGVMTIIAVLYFTFQIIIAGYGFISAAGDEKAIETARKSLTNGVLGLTIVIVAIGLGTLIATLLGIPNVLDIESLFSSMGL